MPVSDDRSATVFEGDAPPTTARKAAIAVGIVLAALVALLAFSRPADEAEKFPLIGRTAPLVVGRPLNSSGVDEFDMAGFAGSWVVVNFFGTWCPPCVAEHPEFVEFDQWARDQDEFDDPVQLVSVVFNDTDENVQAFFEERGGSWPVVASASAPVEYQVAQIPETFIVNPQGTVSAHFRGEITADKLKEMMRADR